MAPFVRLSRNPHKQLMWIWLSKLMRESRSYQRGLDLACGDLKTFKYFQTRGYVGVDTDESRVIYAREKFGVPVVVSKLEEMADTLSGDFVVCLQTIGFNRYFELSHAVEVIRRCTWATAAKGVLILNAASLSPQQFAEIEALLRNGFETVEVRHYGLTSNSVPKVLSLLLAGLWRVLPSLAKRNDSPAWLFICCNRKG